MTNDLLATIFKPIIPYVLVLISIEIVYVSVLMIFYYRSNYYKDTHYKFLKVYLDNGLKGEYLTYKALSKYEKDGAKFLHNCYIPKGDDETTEIDVLMLHRKCYIEQAYMYLKAKITVAGFSAMKKRHPGHRPCITRIRIISIIL